VTVVPLHVGLGDPRIPSASFFAQMHASVILWVLVSRNSGILGLPSAFQANTSGPRFHLQSLRASGSCHLLFHRVAGFFGMLPPVFPSV
jgi:hypothetical protein